MSIRDTDLVSQTDVGGRVEPNLGNTGVTDRGNFYNTTKTQKVEKESPAFDLSNAHQFVALTGGAESGPQESMLLGGTLLNNESRKQSIQSKASESRNVPS